MCVSVVPNSSSNRKNIGSSTATGGNIRLESIHIATFSPPDWRGKRASA